MHIPHTLQLRGVVSKKVTTIVCVTFCTEQGGHNLHMAFNDIPIHEFVVEVIHPCL